MDQKHGFAHTPTPSVFRQHQHLTYEFLAQQPQEICLHNVDIGFYTLQTRIFTSFQTNEVYPKLPLLAWRQGLARTVLHAIEEVFGSSSALNAHGGIPSK
jgi:hypothetical protein